MSWPGAQLFFSAVPRYSLCVPSLPDLNGTAPHQIQCAPASLQLFAAVGQTSSSLFLAVGKFFEVFAITKRGIGSGPLSVFSAFASKCLFAGFWQFFFSIFFDRRFFKPFIFSRQFFFLFSISFLGPLLRSRSLSLSQTPTVFPEFIRVRLFFGFFCCMKVCLLDRHIHTKLVIVEKKVVTKMSNFAPKKQSVKNN